MTALYAGVQFSSDVGGTLGKEGMAPIDHPNPGHGYSGTATYSISPTLINEFTVGKSWNTWSYYPTDDGKSQDRSLISNIPVLFPIPTTAPTGASVTNGYYNLLPQFSFGTVSGGSSMSMARNGTNAGNYENFNTIWTVQDNVSKVIGRHSLKTGVYIENNHKIQPSSPAYAGNFSFSPDTNNALGNTTNGYANALLGNITSYSQATARAVFNVKYWNAEFYIQDNWRVTQRLTLDIGLRFYHQTPQVDINGTFSNFVPANFDKSASPRVYIPGTSAGKRVAIDPGTGTVAPVAYIGLYRPEFRRSGQRLPPAGFQRRAAGALRPVSAGAGSSFRLRLRSDRRWQDRVAGRLRHLLQPSRWQPGLRPVGPTAIRLYTPGELHHVLAARIQRQQPGIRTFHFQLVAVDPGAVGPRAERQSQYPEVHHPEHAARRGLCRQLGVQPATLVRHQPDSDRHTRALQQSERGCDQRQQDPAGHPSANGVSRLQYDQ